MSKAIVREALLRVTEWGADYRKQQVKAAWQRRRQQARKTAR
jgi:hypothetical protein